MPFALPPSLRSLGGPPVTAQLPRPLRVAARVGGPAVYLITAALVAAIIALNPGEWRQMIWGEETPFVWLSCSLLLAAGLLALLTGLVQLLEREAARPALWGNLAWFICGGAMLLADLDERFRIHERVTSASNLTDAGAVAAHVHPLLIVYVLCGCAFGIVLFQRYRPSLAIKTLFCLGVLAFALSTVVEVFAEVAPAPVLEELLEFAAAASFVVSFLFALLHELAELAHPRIAQEDSPSPQSS